MLSDSDELLVVEAVRKAELQTSGEIVVHIEASHAGDPYQRAIHWFQKLGLHKTKDRNGVLILLIEKQRKFAIIGDQGIHAALETGYWDAEASFLSTEFAAGRHAAGLCRVIERIGERLKQRFPCREDDQNELSDTIGRAS